MSGLELTIPAIVSLALVDSINPCAIAVLAFLIIAYMTHNPNEKRKALLAGAMFIAAVYIVYLIYALALVEIMSVCMEAISGSEIFIYGFFSLFAVALGVYNIKDYAWYQPGGFLREMPMKWRPRMQKILAGIESPKGGFILGVFVTIFLLPCTIGPLIMACTILAKEGLVAAVPWLLLYNAIFVLPMIAIVAAIYVGMTMVENVVEWKDSNIKYLHLIAGLIMLAIGLYLAWSAEAAFSIPLGVFSLNFFTIGIIEVPALFALILLGKRKKTAGA